MVDWDEIFKFSITVALALIALVGTFVYIYVGILPPDDEVYFQQCVTLENEDPYFTDKYENGSWPIYELSEAKQFQPAIDDALDGEQIRVNESYYENHSHFFVERNNSVFLCDITTPGAPA